jgi:Ca2+-binding EF-hand superfamily protein
MSSSGHSEIATLREDLQVARVAQDDAIQSIRALLVDIRTLAGRCRVGRPKFLSKRVGDDRGSDSKRSNNTNAGSDFNINLHAPDHKRHPDGPSFYSSRTLADQLGTLRMEIDRRKLELDKSQSFLDKEKVAQEHVISQIMSAATKVMLVENGRAAFDKGNGNLGGIPRALEPHHHLPTNVMTRPDNTRRVFTYSRNMFVAYNHHEARKVEREAKRTAQDRLGLIALTMATEQLTQRAKEAASLPSSGRERRKRGRRRSTFLRGVLSLASGGTGNAKGTAGSSGYGGASVSAKWLTDASFQPTPQPHSTMMTMAANSNTSTAANVSSPDATNFATAQPPGLRHGRGAKISPTSPPSRGAGKLSVPREFLEVLFSRMDTDGNGEVDRDEFLDGMLADPDVTKLFNMKIGDDVNTTFQDVFSAIDDDRSNVISLEEFIAYFEIHSVDVHKAGEMVDAIFEEEDSWYVARVVKAIQNTEERRQATSYVLRFRGYEDDGKFEVPADMVRARLEPGVPCEIMLDHNLIAVHGGTPAFIVSQTEEGYVVRIPSDGNRVTKCFASDVFKV